MATKTVTIEINDVDEKALLYNIVDINVYMQGMLTNKIGGCWNRFKTKWMTTLINDSDFTDAIPAVQADFIALVLARSDYKDRAARIAAGEEL